MSQNNSSSGIIIGMLGVAFVVLKLTDVINWSWWWVTLPFWGGFALVILIILGVLVTNAFAKVFIETKKDIKENGVFQINPNKKPRSTFQKRLEEMEGKRKK